MTETTEIYSRIEKMGLIDWQSLSFIQSENFKELDEAEKHRLKASLLSNSFVDCFTVWQEPNTSKLYCIDGKHRWLMLRELIEEGKDVPYQPPAVFVRCENIQEAAKLVLVKSSQYAAITLPGLKDFIDSHELDWFDVKQFASLGISPEKFEQKFDLYNINSGALPENENAESIPTDAAQQTIVVKRGDLFALGNHRLLCDDFQADGNTEMLMDGCVAHCLMTDPPYNLKADEFSNAGQAQFQNFAFGGGEMTDDEFKDFLKAVFSKAIKHTKDGAIHYMFMDFRHAWHVCQAAYEAYPGKSKERRTAYSPKQLFIWKKDLLANGSFGRAQHELCFCFKSGTAKHTSNIDLHERVRANVWEYPSATSMANPDRNELKHHPTPKPVAMIADAILDTTNEGDSVIDFFMGSGTTLIACEQTRRRAYGTEIEPAYMQHIIQRYIRHCRERGYEPRLSHLNGSLTLADFEQK